MTITQRKSSKKPINPNSHRNFVFGKFTEKKPDTGYTCMCPKCAKRFGIEKNAYGKSRDIKMIVCDDCLSKKRIYSS